MADRIVPHFHNQAGVAMIGVGAADSCASVRRRRSIIRTSSSTWAADPRSSAPIARRSTGIIPRSIRMMRGRRKRVARGGRDD